MAPRQDIKKKKLWQNHDQTLICENCRQIFQRRPGRGRRPKFCTIVCKDIFHVKLRQRYRRYNKICDYCEQPFKTNQAKQKYCSQKCSAKGLGEIRYKLNRAEIAVGYKKCGRCGLVKLLKDFNPSEKTLDGYLYRCKKCISIQYTEYISQPGNLETKLSKQRAKGRTRKQKDRKNKLQNIIRNRRLKTDPRYKLSEGVRCSIRMSLRKRGDSKRGYHWEDLVGWALDDLKVHLEKQFKAAPSHAQYGKMSWANFGKWHIDHIIPISAFNFTRPEDLDFKRCWALSNLKPLWAPENLSKGAKLDKPFQPALAIGVGH